MERHGLTFTNPGSLEKVLGLRLRNRLAVGAGQRLGGDGVEAWFRRGELAPLAQTAAALALQEGSCTVELQCFDKGEQKWQQGSSTGLGGWVHFCGAQWGTLLRACRGQPGLVLLVVAVSN